MQLILNRYQQMIQLLNTSAPWLGWIFLRVLVGWEFLEAGLIKYDGYNWFVDVQTQFPFPFNVIDPSISWFMATWFEILGGIGLIIGLGTRFFSISLIILTVVATATVHWPENWQSLTELFKGYAITDKGFGNYKLPTIFIAMLIPLLLCGAGKLSLDYLFSKLVGRQDTGRASI